MKHLGFPKINRSKTARHIYSIQLIKTTPFVKKMRRKKNLHFESKSRALRVWRWAGAREVAREVQQNGFSNASRQINESRSKGKDAWHNLGAGACAISSARGGAKSTRRRAIGKRLRNDGRWKARNEKTAVPKVASRGSTDRSLSGTISRARSCDFASAAAVFGECGLCDFLTRTADG